MDTLTNEVSSLAKIKVMQADGFVLVTTQQSGAVPPYRHVYDYKRFDHLNDALDEYALYEDGEFSGWSPVAIFPCRYGMPFAAPLSEIELARMLKETRAA